MRQLFVTGFVASEPQTKTSNNTGTEYIEFSIGSQEFREQSPIFYTVRVLNDRLRGITNTLKKGYRVVVNGDYTDSAYCKDGNAMVGRYITAHSIDYVQGVGGNNNGGNKSNGGGNYQKKQYSNQGNGGHQANNYQQTAPQQNYTQSAPAQMQHPSMDDLPF